MGWEPTDLWGCGWSGAALGGRRVPPFLEAEHSVSSPRVCEQLQTPLSGRQEPLLLPVSSFLQGFVNRCSYLPNKNH